jgi:hypothetical protein
MLSRCGCVAHPRTCCHGVAAGGDRGHGGGPGGAHGTECTVDATVALLDPARWSRACRRGTAAFMLDTGGGTHLTFAFVQRGCEDPGKVQDAILSRLADTVTGCVQVPTFLVQVQAPGFRSQGASWGLGGYRPCVLVRAWASVDVGNVAARRARQAPARPGRGRESSYHQKPLKPVIPT